MLCIMGQYLGMTALALEYHLCPDISIPQQVDECIEAYKYILNTLKVDNKKVFICGESAGGSLTLLTLQKLNKLGLPQPCGAIPISSFIDLSRRTALKTKKEDGIKDAMFDLAVNDMDLCIDEDDRKQWDSLPEGSEQRADMAQAPKYSALYGDWKGLCPLYISASLNEMMINDNKLIIEKCEEFGVDCEYDFDPYLIHATVMWCGVVPEARDRLIIIIEWMKKKLKS